MQDTETSNDVIWLVRSVDDATKLAENDAIFKFLKVKVAAGKWNMNVWLVDVCALAHLTSCDRSQKTIPSSANPLFLQIN